MYEGPAQIVRRFKRAKISEFDMELRRRAKHELQPREYQ